MSSNVTLVNEIETRVEASAQLLDSKKPGWFRDVSLDDFDIQDPDRCVLTQVYGGFTEGLNALGDALNFAYAFYELDNDNLTNHAWERAILARRAMSA